MQSEIGDGKKHIRFFSNWIRRGVRIVCRYDTVIH